MPRRRIEGVGIFSIHS